MGLFGRIGKKIARRGARRPKLKRTFKRGFLSCVKNPAGKKRSVWVSQGKGGYSGTYSKSLRHVKGSQGRSAEGVAVKLARKGHKRVCIKD